MRLVLEVAETLRGVLPADMPLFVRISATDWVEGGWDLDQSIVLARELQARGRTLSILRAARWSPGPQFRSAATSRCLLPRRSAQTGILTGAVGVITEAEQADEIITCGAADLVLLAREMLREPYWALKAQQLLGEEPDWPLAYGYAVRRPRKEPLRNTAHGPASRHVPTGIERR